MDASNAQQDHYTTVEVAKVLGLAVRSVQLMVDRGELEAWKTPGGHRRISRRSVQAWIDRSHLADKSRAAPVRRRDAERRKRLLVIEDSVHFQNLIALLVQEHCPEVELHRSSDGVAGLAMVGEVRPDVLIVDILLPGIDGATLITSLRTQPQFAAARLIVVTGLSEAERAPYAFALRGIPVVHKPRLATELPALLSQALAMVEASV